MEITTIVGLILGLCGVYCLYLWVKIVVTGQVPQDFPLLSKEYPVNKCREPEVFLAYLKPRLLTLSLIVTVFGLFGAADGHYKLIENWLPGFTVLQTVLAVAFTCVIPLAGLIWFTVCMGRAQKRMW